jgi:uncharacterized protein (TIGR00369 family)
VNDTSQHPVASPPASRTAPFDPTAAGWEPCLVEGFVDLVGPIWQQPTGDSCRYAFQAEHKHHNRRGVVQGGMLMTFADFAMGRTSRFANGQKPQATIQLDVHFVAAVQVGEFVEARCTVVRRTRALMFMSAELVVGTRVVATAHGVWRILGQG